MSTTDKNYTEVVEAGFKKLGEVQEEVISRIGALETKVAEPIDLKGMVNSGDIRDFIDAQVKVQADALEAFVTRVDKMEVLSKRGGIGGDFATKSVGQRVYEHDAFKAMLASFKDGSQGSWIQLGVDGLGEMMWGFKDAILGAAELGALIRPLERAEIVQTPLERSDFLAFVPRISAAGLAAYEYVVEKNASKRGYIRTELNGSHVSAATTLTVVATAHFITSAPGRIELDLGIKTTFLRVASSTTFTMHPTAKDANDNTNGETLGGDAAAGKIVVSDHYTTTAEEGTKPEGTVLFERRTDNFKTMASVIPVTQQQLDSAARVQALIDRRLRTGWRRSVNWNLLYGDPGVDSEQLQGFESFLDAQSLLWSTGESADTRADAVMRAWNLIDSEGTPTLHLNKRDWTKLVTEKASDGHYVHTKMGPMMVSQVGGQMMLGMFPVNSEFAVRLGDFFLIDHANASEWPDKEDGKLQVGTINDDFIKNIARIRYEQSLAHSILLTEAFVNAQWDSQPA